jgi:acetyl-CoA C-acetyltransferase
MFVTGIGKTKFGTSVKDLPEMACEAILLALEDANIAVTEIDSVFVTNFLGGPLQGQLHLGSIISSILPELSIPSVRIEAACASGGAGMYLALHQRQLGNTLVVGVEKMSGINASETAKNIGMAGDKRLDQQEGLIFPAGYALIAQQHMNRYGSNLDDLALVAYQNHSNANLNELAHFYSQKVSLETIKNSQIVSSPLRLFDCCPMSDGACAVVISQNKRDERSVEIAASEMATDSISLSQRNDLTSFMAVKIAAKKAYKEASVKPSEIDVAEVHDCFTIAQLLAMEDLGFCQPGESKSMIRSGNTCLEGDIAVNTSGGLKASGHPIGATGISQIYEIVKQLRGEAGKRQVDDARTGLAHNVGGFGGTAVIHILKT